MWLGHLKWNSKHFSGWLHWFGGHSPVWVAPVRLRCALAFGWWHLDMSPCLSAPRYWTCRCQSPLPGADRHAVTCACRLSRQMRKDWVDPTSSVWLDAHFSYPAFPCSWPLLQMCLGHAAPAWSFYFLSLLETLLNVSPYLNCSHGACALIPSIRAPSLPCLLSFSPCKQLLRTHYLPYS